MSIIKRMLALSGLVGLLGALAIAAPAQASTVKGDCAVLGFAKTQDKADPTIGVRLVGGAGTFNFTSVQIACVGVAKGAPEAVIGNVAATGYYHNTVCGTGKAVGTVGALTGVPAKYNTLISGKKFAVEFVAGVGLFYWHTWAKPATLPKPLPDPKPHQAKTWNLAGLINLAPPAPVLEKTGTPDVTKQECTKAFHITGTVLIDQ